MKTKFCLTLTLFTFITLSFVPNIFAQDTSPTYTVRTVYIVPNDREPDPDMDTKLRKMMKETQQFYANLMEFHGFGRKTFRLETDATGDVIVHHVNGKHSDAHYQNSTTGSEIVWDEIKEKFDTSKNIYVMALDISGPIVAYGGFTVAGFALEQKSHSGGALIPASDPGVALWHEVGHTFGLTHDSRVEAKRWINPDSNDPMITSFCAAEWLDVNRYFNPIQEVVVSDDEEPSVEMLKPSLASSPYNIRLQFEVTDPDGLHQAQLSRSSDYDSGVIACKKLDGKETIVEFVTTHLIGDINEGVGLWLIDKHGNFTSHYFEIDITDLLPRAEIISIPDPNLASAIREAINLKPNDDITQIVMRRLMNFTASNRQITNLTGLEHAVNMQDLFLDNNQIQDLTPLAGAMELTRLDLSENPISDIAPLTQLKNLFQLSCRNTQISDITSLSRLTNLTNLDLTGNPISDVTPLAKLTNLFELSLGSSEQPIRDITPLTELVNLKALTLINASITDISMIAKFTDLTYLNLFEVPINDVSFLTKLTKLKTLWLTSCKINNIRPFTVLKNLEVLSLKDNQISDVSHIVEFTNLRELYLAWNPIEDTEPLRELLRKNTNVKIYLENGDTPFLLVTLSQFRVQRTDAGVVLKWTTESEFDNAGFNILRSNTKNGIFKVINTELIQGAGTTGERNEYTWTDTTAKPETVYYYQIEDVSHAGIRKQSTTIRLMSISARGKLTTRWADLKMQN